MIIKNIYIRNFRSYYGDNEFEFSSGLTLIIGDNGDGKTTFFEALQWLFNTTIDTPNIENFSEMRKSQLEIGEMDKVIVSMTFDHNGIKIILLGIFYDLHYFLTWPPFPYGLPFPGPSLTDFGLILVITIKNFKSFTLKLSVIF